VDWLAKTMLPVETVWSPQSMLPVNAADCAPLATVPEATGPATLGPGAFRAATERPARTCAKQQ